MTSTINPEYLEISITCVPETAEMVAARLFEIDFEGVWEHESGLNAYIETAKYNPEVFLEVLSDYAIPQENAIPKNLEHVNWNEEWERSYPAIVIEDKCYIRAEFHPPMPEIPYQIVIQPKMSFGTGHHDTTRQVVEEMFDKDFVNKKVIDVGCGTGVLGILASMMGAASVLGVDNNTWCYENSLENVQRNHIANMEVSLDDIESYTGKGFEIILANITRNINHDNIPKYRDMLTDNGLMILSGFFAHDLDFIEEQAIKYGFERLSNRVSAKGWTAVSYRKK